MNLKLQATLELGLYRNLVKAHEQKNKGFVLRHQRGILRMRKKRQERDMAYDKNMRGEFSIVPFSLQLGANESEALRNIEKRIFVLDRHNNHFEIFTKSIHLSKQRLLAEIRRQASAAASLFLLRS